MGAVAIAPASAPVASRIAPAPWEEEPPDDPEDGEDPEEGEEEAEREEAIANGIVRNPGSED